MIRTTTVGSYPVPEWLAALPSEQALTDATRMVFALQRQLGIDMPVDGELYRFDVNHPDTNGMIDYFVQPMSGIRTKLGRSDHEAFADLSQMKFRSKAAAAVEGPLGEGGLDLLSDCQRAASVAGGPFKFTLTSPSRKSGSRIFSTFADQRLSMSQSGSSSPTGVENAKPRMPKSTACFAAASVPECHRPLPRLGPRLMPESTTSTRSQ